MPMPTAQQQLDAIENAISVIIGGGVAEYTEAGKTYKNLSLTELQKLRSEYKAEVHYENNGVYRRVVRGCE